MKHQKILLVRVPYSHWMHATASFPVGLGYIAMVLEDAGIDHQVFDMGFRDQGLEGYDATHLMEKIEEYRPDAVGFSLMTLGYKKHYELIKEVKQRFPAVQIWAGGPHISTMRHVVMEECREIDYGFVLEGEEAVRLLVGGEPPASIPGIFHRQDGVLVYNGDPKLRDDIDAISWPKYSGFELNKYEEKKAFIISSRGCPYACTYCPVKLAIGRKIRFRSVPSIMEEIRYWHDRHYRTFVFWDDNFTLVAQRVFDFVDAVKQSGMSGLNFEIPNGVRADRVTRDMLRAMKEIGFSQLSIGVESGSDKVLKVMKKGEKIEDILEAIKHACELDYNVYLYFILGTPGETMEDVQLSFDVALKYPVEDARFYNLILFPGTELFEWAELNNRFLKRPEEYLNSADHFNNDPCFDTEELPLEQRKAAFERGMAVTRQVQYNAKLRKVRRYGVMGKFMARFAVSDFYRKTLSRYPRLRSAILSVRKLVMAQ